MNNYWNTNFPLTQPGSVNFHYQFQTHGPLQAAQTAALALAAQTEVLVHPVLRGAGRADAEEIANQGRFLELQGEGVVIQHVKGIEDGHGMLVRLQNLSTAPVEACLNPCGSRAQTAFRCTPLEEILSPLVLEEGTARALLQPSQAQDQAAGKRHAGALAALEAVQPRQKPIDVQPAHQALTLSPNKMPAPLFAHT